MLKDAYYFQQPLIPLIELIFCCVVDVVVVVVIYLCVCVCVSGMEYVGEVVANVLRINQSRYQYVIDFMNEKDEQEAQEDLNQM